MRERIQAQFENGQPEFGQIDISRINIDIESRDQIPQSLLGLQHLYNDKELLGETFRILEHEIIARREVKKDNGRN